MADNATGESSAHSADGLQSRHGGGALDLVGLLRAAGVEVRDERVAPRPHPFTPVGLVVHHTGTGGDQDLPTLEIVRRGRPDLAGPLCQILLGRHGTVAVISDGHSNHAGPGRSRVLAQVQAGQDVHPASAPDDDEGNQWFYGIEIENDGKGQPYPDVQYAAAVGLAGTLCRHFRWTQRAVIGHKEWTGRKVDPSFDMDAFRTAVAASLAEVSLAEVSLTEASLAAQHAPG